MLIKALMVRHYIAKGDKKRDDQIPEPQGVISYRNIRYAHGNGKWHKLDVYRPENAQGNLPLIVVVHGGGWIYGDKELYHLYAKDLSRRGFAAICFNYPLAPEHRFPKQLESLDKVLVWAKANAAQYGFDLANVFLVGDSAGANLAVQYEAAQNNPEYAKYFSLQFPLKIRGMGLNCGTYNPLGTPYKVESENYIWPMYLGKRYQLGDPRYNVLAPINSSFPPCYVLTGEADFIKAENPLLCAALDKNKVPYVFKEYTSKEGNKLQHVFHCNIVEEHAILANDEECAFFQKLVHKNA